MLQPADPGWAGAGAARPGARGAALASGRAGCAPATAPPVPTSGSSPPSRT